MKVIDLCQPNHSEIWEQFEEILHEAQTGGDRNAKNYHGLMDKVLDHDCFHVMLDDIGVIGFAGLYNNDLYPDNTARALNRAYYAKRIRQSGLTANNKTRAVGGQLAKWVLPEQVHIAKKKGYDGIFFSMQSNTRSRAIVNIAKWINIHDRTYEEIWTTKDDMYFTCPNYPSCRDDRNCWQNVAVLPFILEFELPLDKMTRDEWAQRWSKSND